MGSFRMKRRVILAPKRDATNLMISFVSSIFFVTCFNSFLTQALVEAQVAFCNMIPFEFLCTHSGTLSYISSNRKITYQKIDRGCQLTYVLWIYQDAVPLIPDILNRTSFIGCDYCFTQCHCFKDSNIKCLKPRRENAKLTFQQ